MRILLILCLCLLFNCEDKQTSKQKSSVIKDSIAIEKEAIKQKTQERQYPRLTDKNAMDFFLEFEKEHKENKVRITTSFGVIDLKLYNKTKFHRANFIFLVKQKYFDRTQFYRVINNFMIQGGDSDDHRVAKRRSKIGKYLLPPDTKRGFKHKRGVISMPSSDIENAYKLATPFQFFIVQAKGGAPHLDGEYTAFGEVTKGIEVVDKIAAVKTDEGDWPVHNVYIKSIEIIE